MSGLGLRVLLCAHALWRGKPPLLMPTKTVPGLLGIERVRLARGREEVVAAGLLVKTRAHIRPGSAGGGAPGVQRAAEWDIPHATEAPSFPLITATNGSPAIGASCRPTCCNLSASSEAPTDTSGSISPTISPGRHRARQRSANEVGRAGGTGDTPRDRPGCRDPHAQP